MPFFGKNKSAKTDEPKRRSIFGTLFNPEIGVSLRPLSENATAFTHLLALIFASNGLFPKNHPALLGVEGARLSLSGIFETAWRDLSFTKEGLPKVILFFAVTGTLIFSILAVITFLLFMALGSAHAQNNSTSFFTPPDTTNDLAQGWLNFLFNNQPLPTSIDTNNTIFTQYTGVQQALISALAFYSNAILILAAVILFYHLVAMVVETAHHGQVMGKRANQIWAPIRLVFAIGLLVPVGSAGLNSGQYIVIQMAQWGSGLASQVWNIFTNKSFAYVPPPTPNVQGVAENIVAIAACVQVMNAINTSVTAQNVSLGSGATVSQQSITLGTGQTGYSYQTSPSSVLGNNVCGSVTFTPANTAQGGNQLLATLASDVQSAYATAYAAAYNQAVTDVSPYFTAVPPNFLYNGDAPSAWKDIVGDVATTFQTSLSSQLSSAVSSLGSASNTTTEQGLGWIAAGAYFNQVAYTQGAIEQIITDGLPKVSPPALENIMKEDSIQSKQISPQYKLATDALNALIEWERTPPPSANSMVTNPNQSTSCDDSFTKHIGQELKDFLIVAKQQFDNKQFSVIDTLARFADYTAAINCVWHPANYNAQGTPTGELTIGFQLNGYDVFAELGRLGHANLNTAYDLLNQIVVVDVAAGVASGAGGAIQQTGKGLAALFGGALVMGAGAAQVAGGILGFLGLIFFACGFTLAYFLPLIPFIKFFFNAVSWIATVLEAVVMVPLIALAHINPEGDGLPGASAKSAYFFILNIFLRPVLMVFGLICGFLVFMTAVAFLNTLYMTAVAGALIGTDVGNNNHLVVSRLIFSIMYVVLLYIAANNSFKLIHAFGDNALLWIGQNPHRRESFGEAEDLGKLMPAVSGYAGQQVFSQAQGISGKIASGTKGLLSSTGRERMAGEAPAKPPEFDAAKNKQLTESLTGLGASKSEIDGALKGTPKAGK